MKGKRYLILTILLVALFLAAMMPVAAEEPPLLTYVGSVQVTYKAARQYVLTGKVSIVDELGEPIGRALVIAKWTLPDGTTKTQIALTSPTGLAKFSLEVPRTTSGDVTLCVVDALKLHTDFVPGANDCGSVTLP